MMLKLHSFIFQKQPGLWICAFLCAAILSACSSVGPALPSNQNDSPSNVAKVATSVPAATSASKFDCKTLSKGGGTTPNIPQLKIADLSTCRPEVLMTLRAIEKGKFSFDQDDGTFGNFEKRLPSAASGTYREYTVTTPGASTRGERRIITSGKSSRLSGEYTTLYYTDDHYETFWQVVTGS